MPGISEFVREEIQEATPKGRDWLYCPVAGCTFQCLEIGEQFRQMCNCRHTEPLVRKEEKEKREESL